MIIQIRKVTDDRKRTGRVWFYAYTNKNASMKKFWLASCLHNLDFDKHINKFYEIDPTKSGMVTAFLPVQEEKNEPRNTIE